MIRVLYVDEEADTEGMVSKFEVLREEGIEVHPVTEAGAVMGEVAKRYRSIDLVILDIIMPPGGVGTELETNGGVGTGLVLLRKLREQFEALRIMIVSVRVRSEVETLIPKGSVVAYVQKPIDGTTLARAIKSALSGAVVDRNGL